MTDHTTEPELAELPQSVRAYFAKYVTVGAPSDCWFWKGPVNQQGYGYFSVKGKKYRAHRIALAQRLPPPSPKHFACHACDNPSCCNPRHLWWGTNLDNMRDCVAKGRQTRMRGERHGRAKLTDELVREIRASALPQHILAKRYGVNQSSICDVKRGKSWRHVTDDSRTALNRISKI